MKRNVSILLGVFLLAASGTSDVFAQEEKGEQLWLCWEATVHPDMQKKFVEVQMDFQSKFKEAGFSYPLYCWTDRLFGFYFFYPVDSYDDNERIYEALWKVVPLWGEENFMGMWETVASHRSYFLREVASYEPENPRLGEEGPSYAFWDIMYVRPEKEMEYLELLKKLNAIQQSTDFGDPVTMLYGDLGYEGSVYIGALVGKDPMDFRTQNQKMWELMGEDATAIFQKWMTLLRKREHKEFWYVKELSYIPE
jgi:hypothetical protein